MIYVKPSGIAHWFQEGAGKRGEKEHESCNHGKFSLINQLNKILKENIRQRTF